MGCSDWACTCLEGGTETALWDLTCALRRVKQVLSLRLSDEVARSRHRQLPLEHMQGLSSGAAQTCCALRQQHQYSLLSRAWNNQDQTGLNVGHFKESHGAA